MENWAEQKDWLNMVAMHYETGEKNAGAHGQTATGTGDKDRRGSGRRRDGECCRQRQI